MPRKGMRTIFFSSSGTSTPSHSSQPNRNTFSDLTFDENIDKVESVIKKWDLEEESASYCKVDSPFYGDRSEAEEFCRSVKDLHTAMRAVAERDPSSVKLVRAQRLMQMAMKRLEEEFRRILWRNRGSLDAESVSTTSLSTRSSFSDFGDCASEDEIQVVDPIPEVGRASEIAMKDLKAIADTMIVTGYGKECLQIYKAIRKSITEESLFQLGIEKLSSSQIQKMDWDVIELKIKSWINGAKIAVTSLFRGERFLCEFVFSASPIILESCFADIVREGAMNLFVFPERVAKYKRLSLEKIFRLLDLYDAVSELWPEIEFVFSLDSVSSVRSQAIDSLINLGEATKAMLSEFETAIQKDNSKTPLPGGGVHPLTRYVMNYLILLSDYSGILCDILAHSPLSTPPPMPESYFSSPVTDDHPTPAISLRFAWLVLALLCKLDVKAELYDDVALSYLFRANNLNYVVSKVQSSNLKLLLGDEWLSTHGKKVEQYASNYERIGWGKVISALVDPTAVTSAEEVRGSLRNFCTAFEEAYRKQSSRVVPDPKLRDEIRFSLAGRLLPAYRMLYQKYQSMFSQDVGVEYFVKFAPDNLRNYFSDLLCGNGASHRLSSSSYSYHSNR